MFVLIDLTRSLQTNRCIGYRWTEVVRCGHADNNTFNDTLMGSNTITTTTTNSTNPTRSRPATVFILHSCVAKPSSACPPVMRYIFTSFVSIALAGSSAQGSHRPLAIYRRDPSPYDRINCRRQLRHALVTVHDVHMHQLTTARRQLEALSTRVHTEVQELVARRQYVQEQLYDRQYERNCECGSAQSSLPTAASTAVPVQAVEADASGTLAPDNASWALESVESPMSSDHQLTRAAEDQQQQTGSFFTSTLFALAVFFMAVPVACLLGFVLLYRRRCRRQRTVHTHA